MWRGQYRKGVIRAKINLIAGKKSSTAHVNGVSAEPLLRIDISSQVILPCLHLGLGTVNDEVQQQVPARVLRRRAPRDEEGCAHRAGEPLCPGLVDEQRAALGALVPLAPGGAGRGSGVNGTAHAGMAQ